jgi:hypothetical protein
VAALRLLTAPRRVIGTATGPLSDDDANVQVVRSRCAWRRTRLVDVLIGMVELRAKTPRELMSVRRGYLPHSGDLWSRNFTAFLT